MSVSSTKKWCVGETLCYPSDHELYVLVELPKGAACIWGNSALKEAGKLELLDGTKDDGNWLNKLVIIVTVDYGVVFGVYKHDFKYYIVTKKI